MSVPATKLRFRSGGDFAADLRSEVRAFATPDVIAEARKALHRKAMFIIAWVACSYATLVFLPHSPIQIALCGISTIFAFAALQFNVMHDGNHGAFSNNKHVNDLAGIALDAVGGFSPHWRVKHNVTHHGYTNVVEYDDDIEQLPFARFASDQEWKWWHRWQYLYIWPLYGLMLFRWLTVGDLTALIRGRIQQSRLENSGHVIARLIASKILAFGWTIGIPIALNPTPRGIAIVLLVYTWLVWSLSWMVAVIFQLAHCVDETLFVSPADADENGVMPNSWMVGQVLSTQDFCHGRSWSWLTWFVGGLNYQIEHHLFAALPHTLYPQIAPIVERVCKKHGVRYVCQPTLGAALASHDRHLRNMGRRPVAA